MVVRYTFIDINDGNKELSELPEGKYQLVGGPILEVTFNKYGTGDTEYTFRYRVGRIK